MFKFDSFNWDAMADGAMADSDNENGVNYAKIGRVIYRNEPDSDTCLLPHWFGWRLIAA